MKNLVDPKNNIFLIDPKSRNCAMAPPSRSRRAFSSRRDEAKCASVKEHVMKNRTVYRKSSCAILLSVQLVLLLVIINYFIDATEADGVAARGRHNKAMQFRDSPKMFGGYRITPKFCQPSRPSRRDMTHTEERRGPALCMFNHECSQRNGEVVGTCMDGFLFGACCQLFGTPTLKKDTVDSGVVMMANDPNLRYPEQMTPDKLHIVRDEEMIISVPQIMNTLNDNIHRTTEKNVAVTVKDALSTLKYTNDVTRDPDDELNEQIIEISNQFIKNPSTLGVSMEVLTSSTEKYLDLTSSGVAQIASSLLQGVPNESDIITVGANPEPGLFSHSTISHEEADTILVDNNGSEVVSISRPSDFSAPEASIHVSTMQTKPSMPTQYSTKYVSSTPANRYTHKPVYQKPGSVDGMIFNRNDTATMDAHGSGDSVEEKQSTIDINSSTSSKDYAKISTTTQVNRYPERPPYKKPGFRPKPTREPSKDKFVLVQTVTRPQHPVKTSVTNTDANQQMASIESIIGMLNGSFASDYDSQTPSMNGDINDGVTMMPQTSAKPQYSSGYPAYFDSTTFKYPTGGHFITTTVNKQTSTYRPPSTSYVYNPTVTRRPGYGVSSTISNKYGSSSGFFTRKPTVHDSTIKYQNIEDNNVNNFVSSTLSYDEYWGSPSTPANRKPPSTSYVYSPTPTKRPESNVHHVVGPSYDISNGNLDTFSSVTPTVIVLSGLSDSQYDSQTPNPIKFPIRQPAESEDSPDDSYVSVQTKPQNNKKPVHQLTINNIITSNNMINLGQPVSYRPAQESTSEKPSPTVLITPKPSVSTSSSVANISKPGKPQIIIEDSEKPAASNKPPTTSFMSSTLARRPTTVPTPSTNVHSSPTNGIFAVPTSSPIYVQTSEKNEVQTSPDELINFPPVRNPNLNTTGSNPSVFNNANVTVASDPVLQEVQFTTPAFLFQEDDDLNDKMSLFVNKIVGSLQGTFQELHDIVILDKTPNTTITQQNIKKPSETATKKPTSVVTKKPTSVVTKKPIAPVTTKKPVRTATTVTTKKPKVTKKPAKVTPTTPPSTENPITAIVTQAATTKKPTRLTTTTKKPKPTKAKTPTSTVTVAATSLVTTTEAPVAEEEAPYTTETPDGEFKHLCGVRPMVKSGRIVGGKGATFGEWPWQVLVRESTWLGLFTKNKCGGVLITTKYVTTAAHCQPGFLASLVAVLGEFDISGDLETKRSVTKNVRRVIVHRNYDAATFENDLALLELESPVNYDTHIVPICMPPDEADFTGRFATVTGWGRLKYGGGVPSVLQEVQVPVIENSVCQEMFQTAGHSKIILNSFLCAGYANGQKDSCEGDSGGPLVLQRPDGRWQLAGTVSHGIKCAAPYLPGVYMRTTYYKPWLRSITGVH